MEKPIIERVKTALDCKTSRQLAKRLGVHNSQITRWRKDGFHGQSTELLISIMLDMIERNSDE